MNYSADCLKSTKPPISDNGYALNTFPRSLRSIPRFERRTVKALTLVPAVTFMLALAGTASAVPGSWYWTTAHATAAAKASVKVPFCRVYPTSKNCANGTGNPVPTMAAACVGAGAAVKGRFRQFSCKVTLLNDDGTAQVTVYTAGATVIRWKTVCVMSAETC